MTNRYERVRRRFESTLDDLEGCVRRWEKACQGDDHEEFLAAKTDLAMCAARLVQARADLEAKETK